MPRLPLLKKPTPKSLNRSKSKNKNPQTNENNDASQGTELTCFSRSRARSRYSSRSNFLRKVLSTPTAYGNTQTTSEFKTHITYRHEFEQTHKVPIDSRTTYAVAGIDHGCGQLGSRWTSRRTAANRGVRSVSPEGDEKAA